MESRFNRQLDELASVFNRNRTGEKWIMAPSLRTGFQWLDRLAWHGVPVLNARVKTFPALVLDLCSPEMERLGLSYLNSLGAEFLMDGIIEGFHQERGGYVFGLERTPGLVRTMLRGVFDLRMSGVTLKDLRQGDFEVKTKGKEIKEVLKAFEGELNNRSLIDYAGALHLAVSLVKKSPDILPDNVEIIVSRDLKEGLSYLETELLKSFPEKLIVETDVDVPGEKTGDDLADSELLSWINDPAEAPGPSHDNSASIFRAVGEVNEIREVLRRIVEKSIPFDRVEILHTDSETYVPLFFELASLLSPLGDGYLPATFREGVPARYSRPVRALLGWISWIREDHPQATLTRMIEDGLVNITWNEEAPLVYARIAALFRSVPIGGKAERYLPFLDREIEYVSKESRFHRDDDADEAFRQEARKRKHKELEALRGLCGSLLELSGAEEGPLELLKSAETFLSVHARSTNQLDEYSRRLLLRYVRELISYISEGLPGRDILEWLEEVAQGAMVGGLGPRPGCLYISPLSSGGHSGRPYTFVVGLDESRFPGAGLQDPLLLDDERTNISGRLPTSTGRTEQKVMGLARLFSRLRGHVTLSCPSRSLEDDRDLFPSTALMSAFRILSGNKQGVLEDLEKWTGPPVSFAPDQEGRCIDPTEWWLHRMCGQVGVKEPETVIAKHFPHLGQGFKAKTARQSQWFTEYDGHVPKAGEKLDPSKEHGMLLSSSKLEVLGQSPLAFFFKYVLKIEPPEEYIIDPEVWLDPLEKGSLLHEVFRKFINELKQNDEIPSVKKHADRLYRILEEMIEDAVNDKPPPGPAVFEREKRFLVQTARIFLLEEEAHCQESRPLFLEAGIGLASETGPTELDTDGPAELRLPDGKTIKACGRLDRIDRLVNEGENSFAVWDYKTGNYNKYSSQDPFKGGRVVQNALYLEMAQARLQELFPGACVKRFGFFFPSARRHGERTKWEAAELEKGREVIANLCGLLASGCFPVSEDNGDNDRSDYRQAMTDDEIAYINAKLQNPENEMLRPFVKLRGLEENDER